MQIVVLGAGYAGVTAALQLARKGAGFSVTLINDRPEHTLVTLLHKVAAGSVSPDAVQIPLWQLFDGTGVQVVVDRVVEIDLAQRLVHLAHGRPVGYDRLVVALGSEPESFGIPGVHEHALPIQPVGAAIRIRERLRALGEEASLLPAHPDALVPTHIVVAGGGLTGVEVAGELADLLPASPSGHRRPGWQVTLVEAAPRILPGFSDRVVAPVRRALLERGVRILENSPIAAVDARGVQLAKGERLDAALVIWAGGVRANRIVAAAFASDGRGRALVDPYLRVLGHPDVYVVGDCARAIPLGSEQPAAPTAQNAIQQAKTAVHNIVAEAAGRPLRPYVSSPLGIAVSVGTAYAVAELRLAGLRPRLDGWAGHAVKRASELRYLVSIGA